MVKNMTNLHELSKYFSRYCGVVGELDTCMAATIGTFAANQNVLLFGPSSGGKTKVAESVLSLCVTEDIKPDELFNDPDKLLQDGGIYRYEFGSDKDIAYAEDELEVADLLFVPELQKVAEQQLILEVLKTMGEGRTAYRNVIRDGGKSRERQKMEHAPIFSTIASENQFDLEEKIELQNRLLQLHIDDSSEQTQNIMREKAKSYITGELDNNNGNNFDPLPVKRHVETLWENCDLSVENPYAVHISEDYLPEKYVLSRRFIDYYLEIMAGVTRWNYVAGNRMSVKHNGTTKTFTSLEDVYVTECLIGSEIRGSMLKLPPQAQHIFKIFDKVENSDNESWKELKAMYDDSSRVMLPSNVIMQKLGEMGITMNLPNLQSILNTMSQYGYLLASEGRQSRYGLMNKANPQLSTLDYQTLLQSAEGTMQDAWPIQADKWKDKQSLIVRDPITGEEVNLTELGVSEKNSDKTETNPGPVSDKVVESADTGIQRFIS